MTKTDLEAKIYEIQSMGRIELEEFRRKVEDSMLEPKQKGDLRTAIVERENKIDLKNCIAECGEIKFAEFDDA